MLSGIVGSVDISFWPQVALVLFFGIFVVAGVRVWRMAPQDSDAAARLPLDD